MKQNYLTFQCIILEPGHYNKYYYIHLYSLNTHGRYKYKKHTINETIIIEKHKGKTLAIAIIS